MDERLNRVSRQTNTVTRSLLCRGKMKLLFVPLVLMSALVIVDSKPKDTPVAAWPTQWTTEWTTQWTTGAPGLNLKGKMFTLARYSSAVTLYHPYFPISSLSLTPETELEKKPRPTRSYPTTTHPPRTTASPATGVSVCLRYMIDYLEQRTNTIFKLSPSSSPLSLTDNFHTSYVVNYYYSTSVYLQPNIQLWSNILPSAWTSVCLTIDSKRRVIQMFKGPFMSIRKVLPGQYDWSGEPVMQFSGTAGQVKDVQVWNYPLRYNEVYYYMTDDSYGSPQGNILSWSYVSYSVQGQSFLENSYESQAKQPIRKGRRQKGAARSRKVFTEGEAERTQEERL